MTEKRILQIIRWSICVAALMCFSYGVIAEDTRALLLACVLLWLNNVLLALDHLYKNILFLGFNLSFFFFLMGRLVVNFIRNGTYGIPFDSATLYQVLLELCLSLIVLFAAYSLRTKIKIISRGTRIYHSHVNEESFKNVCKGLYYCTLMFALWDTAGRITTVQTYGYAASYAVASRTPFFIQKLGAFNEYFFYGFCAAMPSKKECRLPFLLFIMSGTYAVLTGQRGETLLKFLFVIVYCFLRHKPDEKWITRSMWLLLLAFVPVVAWFIVWYGAVRGGGSFTLESWGDLWYTLFDQQGYSVSVLAYQREFADAVEMQQNFTFGPLWTIFTQNPLSLVLTGGTPLGQNTVERALQGHSFAHTVSYMVLGNLYLLGLGCGSSYIAEVTQDYGYIGIIMINLLYAKAMKMVRKFEDLSLLPRLYTCYIIQGILFAPRSSAIGPFASILSFSSLSALAVAFLLTMLITAAPRVKKLKPDKL